MNQTNKEYVCSYVQLIHMSWNERRNGDISRNVRSYTIMTILKYQQIPSSNPQIYAIPLQVWTMNPQIYTISRMIWFTYVFKAKHKSSDLHSDNFVDDLNSLMLSRPSTNPQIYTVPSWTRGILTPNSPVSHRKWYVTRRHWLHSTKTEQFSRLSQQCTNKIEILTAVQSGHTADLARQTSIILGC